VAKGEAEVYKPAEACRIAEVAPYVLRYWETEFPALSEGKEKGTTRLYTARDVKIIARIRELLYDEGFTVAGAKKRLEAEIIEGRFDDGLAPAPPLQEQRKAAESARARSSRRPAAQAASDEGQPPLLRVATADAGEAATPAARKSLGSGGLDRGSVIRELREIVKLLDRGAKK
jgi:DNA-binding transcriptional MerR regulator